MFDVFNPSEDFQRQEERRQLPRALMGGTWEMRRQSTKWLPQDPLESEPAYRARLERTVLYNHYRHTVEHLVGKVFCKPIVQVDIPEDIEGYLEDVDLLGNNLDVFAQKVLADGLVNGLSYILVDMPAAPQELSLAEQEINKIRPYWVFVKAENLIGFKSRVRNGVMELTQVRIREYVTVEDGEFSTTVEERVRVIDLLEGECKFTVYTTQKDSTGVIQLTVIDSGFMTVPVIPLIPFYAQRDGFMTALPPLEDLAYMNLSHYQNSSDQNNIMHVARVPILFGKGLSEEAEDGTIVIGPNRLIAGGENSDLKYVEHTGMAISSGRSHLQDIESHMAILGVDLLMQRPGYQPATNRVLDAVEMTAPLQMISMSLSDALDQALVITGHWVNKKPEEVGSVKVNTDFGVQGEAIAVLQSLLDAVRAGTISVETFWHELSRRHILSVDFDPTKEKSRLKRPALHVVEGGDPQQEDPDPNANDPLKVGNGAVGGRVQE